jgi:DNA polymerase-3 subunit epsilon/CBS domain-containing protein
LTPRNLLRDRAMAAIVIGDAIAAAASPTELAAAWGSTPAMAAALRREGVEGRQIAATLSAEIQAITRRAAELAEAEMVSRGLGPAPVPYAVLVLGSAGRGESLLAADQDNAIVYADGEEGGAADRWLEAMAGHMNRILDEAGIPLCKGGVMARNRLWRHSVEGWRTLIASWIGRQRPADLLNVDIFFDALPVAGERRLGEEVLGLARERARGAPDFLKMLTELARQWRAPLTLLGGFQKVDGRVDLKKGGLMPIFTAARVMALRNGIAEVSTRQRLEAVAALGHGAPSDYEAVIAAHEVLLAAVLEQQIEDARRGVPLSARVVVDRLSAKDRRRLKEAVQVVETALALVSEGRI